MVARSVSLKVGYATMASLGVTERTESVISTFGAEPRRLRIASATASGKRLLEACFHGTSAWGEHRAGLSRLLGAIYPKPRAESREPKAESLKPRA